MAALWDEMMMGNSTRRAVPGSAFEFFVWLFFHTRIHLTKRLSSGMGFCFFF